MITERFAERSFDLISPTYEALKGKGLDVEQIMGLANKVAVSLQKGTIDQSEASQIFSQLLKFGVIGAVIGLMFPGGARPHQAAFQGALGTDVVVTAISVTEALLD